MASHPESAAPNRAGGRGARERILEAAAELFYRDGINATGVERLAKQASVSKRTLYQHFPSKADIVEQYLCRLGEGYSTTAAQGADRPARQRLLAIFDMVSDGRVRGCPFHNAAVEAADAMPDVQAVVNSHKKSSITALTALAAEAGAREPELLGRQLAVLFEGAMALATSLNDGQPIQDARAAAETLIDLSLQGSTSWRPPRARKAT